MAGVLGQNKRECGLNRVHAAYSGGDGEEEEEEDDSRRKPNGRSGPGMCPTQHERWKKKKRKCGGCLSIQPHQVQPCPNQIVFPVRECPLPPSFVPCVCVVRMEDKSMMEDKSQMVLPDGIITSF